MSEQTCADCGLPIQGSGPCAYEQDWQNTGIKSACGGLEGEDFHWQTAEEWNQTPPVFGHPYQPSTWEHAECMDAGCSMKRGPNCDYVGDHPATPTRET